MKVRLDVSRDKANVRRVTLQSDAVIGRSSDCNLRIASSRVSRRHCKITISDEDEEVLVRDLGSSNGTYVDGRRIEPKQDVPVTEGTRLSIGPAQFVVHIEGKTAAKEAASDSTVDYRPASEEAATTVVSSGSAAAGGSDDGTREFQLATSAEPAEREQDSRESEPPQPEQAGPKAADEPGGEAEAPDETETLEATAAVDDDTVVEARQEDDDETLVEETFAEDEGDEDDAETDEDEPEERQPGKLASLFGMFRRRKAEAANEDDEDPADVELEEAGEADEEIATEPDETVADEEPMPASAGDEPDEDQVNEFLTGAENENTDEEGPPADEEELGDFLKNLEEEQDR